MKIKPLSSAKKYYPKGSIRENKTYTTYRESGFPNISLFKGDDGKPYRVLKEYFEVV